MSKCMLKIFTEAGDRLGFGHFTRMSSICQAFIDKGLEVKMFLDGDDVAKKLLGRSYVSFEKWKNENDVLTFLNKNDFVIVDSYYVSLETLKKIKENCKKLLIIDDNIRLNYEKMEILNPNYFSVFLNYPMDNENTYFLGGEYNLLRKEFRDEDFKREIVEEVENVLVTLGGTDVMSLTDKVIKEIKESHKEAKISVVVTKAYDNIEKIKNAMGEKDQLYIEASALEMKELMKKADCVVSNGGGTSNELIKMKCPSAMVVVADNQEQNVEYLSKNSLCIPVEPNNLESIKLIFDYKYRKEIYANLCKMASKKTGIDLVLEQYENIKI